MAFHGPGEPKDLRYLGWKLGVYPQNVDEALDTMIADSHRDNLVLGKTKEQLIKRFGFVSSVSEADEYVNYCYDNSQYRGKPVLFLRKSHWMVSLENGRANILVLVKGC